MKRLFPVLLLLTACGDLPPEDIFASNCKVLVKDRLKAPATAQFSASYEQVQATGGTYRWAGTVDAENSFGANVRTAFVCAGTPERMSVSLY